MAEEASAVAVVVTAEEAMAAVVAAMAEAEAAMAAAARIAAPVPETGKIAAMAGVIAVATALMLVGHGAAAVVAMFSARNN